MREHGQMPWLWAAMPMAVYCCLWLCLQCYAYAYNYNYAYAYGSAYDNADAGYGGFDFKTTFHKNPQLTTTYRQKAPIAQYVCRIDAQIAVRFCAICSIYIMPKAIGDILTISI